MTDRTELRPAEREALHSPDRRLYAYYFGFDSTEVPAIDAILSAVAYAGKGYHHTEGWGDKDSRWGEDRSHVDVIQAAAHEAAARLDAAEAALARVRELHERESFWQYDRDQERSYLTQQDAADDSGCDCPEDPESVYLAHTPECRPRSPRDAQPNRRTERSMTALPSGDHIASEGHDCTLTIGSLFSGYGGLERAVEEVFDARTAWVSDIDRGACKVLAHRYPHAPNLGDITRVDWAAVEPVDIITGGSPCQDLSHAGRRAGMTEGTRSNLWASMREAIATIRPRLVVWENVQGALSVEAASDLEHCPGCMGDPRHGRPVLRALGRVLGDLADLGFDAEVVGLRAADVGACHGRFRVFVLAYAHGARLQGQPHPQGAPSPQRHRHPVAGAGGPDLTLLPTPRATDGSKGGPNQRGSSGDLMLPSAVARLLPTPRTSDTNGAAQHGTGGADLRTAVQLLPTPSVADTQGGRKHRSGERNDELLLNGIAHADRWGDYAAAIARHEHAWGVPAPEPTEPGAKGNPRLSAAFCEWMMMQPAGWITDTPGITRNEALKLCGNGVVTPQAAHALRVMLNRIDGRSAA